MWNVNIINSNHQISSNEILLMEFEYRKVLEKYGLAAVKMQADETAGLEDEADHFELGNSAWAWVCGQAHQAAMDAVGWAPDVQFETTWIDRASYCYHGELLTNDCPYCAEETGMTLPMPRGERLVYAH